MSKHNIFIVQYCSCGVRGHIPVKSETVRADSINDALKKAGWKLLLTTPINEPDVWLCNKCRELLETDPDKKL